MSSTNEKKEFDWEKGSVLDEENTKPLGGVRARGIPKLKKAVHADPVVRKEERDNIILKEKSKSYQDLVKEVPPEDDGLVVFEESQSGLSGEYEDSAAKKLIDTGKKFKGLGRFGKKKDKPKK